MSIMSGQLRTPPVVLNLIIINGLIYFAERMIPGVWRFMIEYCALYFPESHFFKPHQLLTYMFMHDNMSITHVFFNMFSLWMFGRSLEYDLGSRRFLTYYIVCGVGAALFFWLVSWVEFSFFRPEHYIDILRTPTLGASGAVFGILLAFGLMHPNSVIMLIFPPIALKAKYFVIIYGVIELLLGVGRPGDSVAHFAHVGGMLWGFMLLWWWKRRGKVHY